MKYCFLQHQTFLLSPVPFTTGCFFLLLLLLFYFILFFKLYIIVLVLPNIKMNPPQVYMCLFLIWLHSFILSGVISPLISSSILGTYRPGEFIFQCPIFLPFHTVHGVLKERILKWFAIPFSSGPHSVRPLHHDPAILGGPTWHGLVSLS